MSNSPSVFRILIALFLERRNRQQRSASAGGETARPKQRNEGNSSTDAHAAEVAAEVPTETITITYLTVAQSADFVLYTVVFPP